MMVIVHVVESFAGGVFEFLTELTNGLNVHKHYIIHGQRENTPVSFRSRFPYGTIFIPWRSGREISIKQDLESLSTLLALLKPLRHCGVIHLHSSKAGFLGRIAARMLGLQGKTIYTPHAVSFLRKDVSDAERHFYICLEKLAQCTGGKVVACSASEAAELKKQKIEACYINNGINLHPYACLEANGVETTKITIGTIGRISAQKNPGLFNKIAERFCSDSNVNFLWIGDGELRAHLTSANVTVTGWKTAQGVIDELSKAHIYLSTSLWEGLPLAVIQAMAAGLPLVLSNCTGNIDMVHLGKNGWVFSNEEEAYQKLLLLSKNFNLRKNTGQKSRTMAESEFCLSQMVKGYQEQYEKTKM